MTTDPNNLPTIGMTPPASAVSLPAGEAFGDYILEGEVGRGGMGVVYKAFEPVLGRHVAIKMILSAALPDVSDVLRFQAEAAAAARLQHPNIVKVHRVGAHGGRQFFAMTFIDGVSLAARTAAGPLPGKTAAAYMVTVARAIHHAHEAGILHRDLKPSNILLDADDRPHVTDFGLAKNLGGDSHNTRTGTLVGTPSYMAPEQAQAGKNLTPATDVYGLGALMYELLTGRPPFKGESPVDTVYQVLENEPVPPRLLNPRLDRDLETICLKCLSKRPADRYATAAALADDLQRYLDGASVQARSLNLFDYLGRTLERSQFDQEFRLYGNAILAFAVIVGVFQAVIAQWLLLNVGGRAGVVWLQSAHVVQFACMFAVMWYSRRQVGFLPTTTAERLLYAVWGGYVLTCAIAGSMLHAMFGTERVFTGINYPVFFAISGLAFLILGSSFWGWFTVFGAAFYAVGWAIIVADATRFGPAAYGLTWVVALTLIGIRLRKLGAERSQSEKGSESSG